MLGALPARISHRVEQESFPGLPQPQNKLSIPGITHLIREPETALRKKEEEKKDYFSTRLLTDSKHGERMEE